MTDTQLDTQPPPAPARQPRRRPASPTPAAVAEPQTVVPTVEAATTEPGPTATVAEPDAPAPAVVAEPAPAAAPPPAPTRRGHRGPKPSPIAALDLALPGVRTAEILAELDRRQRRAKALIAERERVIAVMVAIEAALEVIGK